MDCDDVLRMLFADAATEFARSGGDFKDEKTIIVQICGRIKARISAQTALTKDELAQQDAAKAMLVLGGRQIVTNLFGIFRANANPVDMRHVAPRMPAWLRWLARLFQCCCPCL